VVQLAVVLLLLSLLVKMEQRVLTAPTESLVKMAQSVATVLLDKMVLLDEMA